MIPEIDKAQILAQELPKQTAALVLAGGRGSRLKELTLKRAKPAVHFGGKFRIIDFALSNCLNSGIRKIGVLTQYQSHSLIQHLQKGWSFLNEEMNEFIDLLPAQQRNEAEHWYGGTGDAIFQNMDIIKRYRAKYIIILAGDHIYKMDYAKMLLDHVDKGAKCTVACIEIPIADAKHFGILDVDKQGKISQFIEKPENPELLNDDQKTVLASMGIYIFNSNYLFNMLEKDNEDKSSSHDFGHDIIPKAVAAGEAWAHSFERSCVKNSPQASTYWRDVGTIDAYWRANLDLASVMPELNMYDHSWPIRTYVEPLPPAKFVQNLDGGPGMTINSLIGSGDIINGSMVINSVLFSKVRINSFCAIDSSILLPNVVIGNKCHLSRCIIDQACIIPDEMVIGMNPEEDRKRFSVSEKGIVLVTKDMMRKLGFNQG